MKLAWAFLILTAVSPAFAQAPGDPAPPPPPPPAPTEPMLPPPAPAPAAPGMTASVAPVPAEQPAEPTDVDLGTLDDANAGRIAIMPTALTPPKGAIAFEDWELFLITLSYGVTDHLVISGTTMIPVSSDFYWGFISAKLQVARQGNLRLAVQAGAAGFIDSNSSMTSSDDSAGGFDVGGAATYCLDEHCYSHIDGSIVAAFARQNNSSVPVGFSGGLVAKAGRHMRVILEADTAHLFGEISGQANGFLGWYGVRFTSRNIGVDLTLVKPICSDCSSDVFPFGFPFLTFSYRAL